MGGKGSGTPKAALLKLDGTQVDKLGVVTETDFFSFLQLPAEHYANLEIEMTPEQALKFRNHIIRMKVGTSAIIPMVCGGPRCPVKLCPFHETKTWPLATQCHPPGTLIKTGGGSDVPIEDLDPSRHGIISMRKKNQLVRTNWKRGYAFRLASRTFHGRLVQISTEKTRHSVTPDHISLVRFNEKAVNKFCVYLMRKGSHWRIGKSKILAEATRNNHNHRYRLAFPSRGLMEEADAMWILGVYETNTEALLAEEYFSITWQTSKVSFVDSLLKIESKYNGLYRWATREQIQAHHTSLAQSEEFYRAKLAEIDRSIDFPIWDKQNPTRSSEEVKLYTIYPMYIRACNILPEIMDIPVFPIGHSGNLCSAKVSWESVRINHEEYKGPVYSLDVHSPYKTYFANNIATHNCPIEANLITTWMKNYIDDLEIDVQSRTEMVLINKLVECDIIDYRANIALSTDEDAWKLLKVDITDTGKATIENTNAHPILEIKERTQSTRQKVLESLIATRKERAKKIALAGARSEGEHGQHWADLKTALKIISKVQSGETLADLKKDLGEPVNADWETVE